MKKQTLLPACFCTGFLVHGGCRRGSGRYGKRGQQRLWKPRADPGRVPA